MRIFNDFVSLDLAILCGLVCITSCTAKNKSAQHSSPKNELAFTCAEGDWPMQLALTPLPAPIQFGSSAFAKIDPQSKAISAGPNNRIRLDVCMSATGKASIKSVVTKLEAGTPDGMTYDAADESFSNGFEDFNFNASYSAIDLSTSPLQLSEWFTTFVVLGTGSGDAGYALAGLAVQNSKGQLIPIEGQWIVGKLIEGNPFAENICPIGESFEQVVVEIGTAKITSDKCIKSRNISAREYTIVRVEIVDNNLNLATEWRGTRVYTGDALKDVLTYTITHHNLFDTFSLHIEGAEYQNNQEGAHSRTGVKYGSNPWQWFQK